MHTVEMPIIYRVYAMTVAGVYMHVLGRFPLRLSSMRGVVVEFGCGKSGVKYPVEGVKSGVPLLRFALLYVIYFFFSTISGTRADI
jgi:hypothetical protein